MRSGTKSIFARSALRGLGVIMVMALLPLALLACASSPKQATLPSLASRLEVAAVQPTPPAPKPSAAVDRTVREPRPAVAQETAAVQDPLQAFAMVPEEELQEMRGCHGGVLL
jgi:hypothetical protein